MIWMQGFGGSPALKIAMQNAGAELLSHFDTRREQTTPSQPVKGRSWSEKLETL
jgi:hypothetical protein